MNEGSMSAASFPMDAKQKLRIFILEDVQSDADLMEGALRQAGFAFSARRTDTRKGFIEALDSFKPDVVLCDYELPKFDGLSAIKLVREKSADLPVIAVTGALGDEAAVALIKAGANDYILKDRLARLGAAVGRALTEAAAIRDRAEAEQNSQRRRRSSSAGSSSRPSPASTSFARTPGSLISMPGSPPCAAMLRLK